MTVLALLVIVRIKWHHRIWFLIGDLVKIVMLLEVGGAHGPPLHQRNYWQADGCWGGSFRFSLRVWPQAPVDNENIILKICLHITLLLVPVLCSLEAMAAVLCLPVCLCFLPVFLCCALCHRGTDTCCCPFQTPVSSHLWLVLGSKWYWWESRGRQREVRASLFLSGSS